MTLGQFGATLAVVLALVFCAFNVSRMFACWDAGGEYVNGVSLTGYVCLKGPHV